MRGGGWVDWSKVVHDIELIEREFCSLLAGMLHEISFRNLPIPPPENSDGPPLTANAHTLQDLWLFLQEHNRKMGTVVKRNETLNTIQTTESICLG